MSKSLPMEIFELLIGTVILRPYVFVFLAFYLAISITHIGWRRTLLYTTTAYIVAFICEWSSAVAYTGFPFGLYKYIPDTVDKELWIAGVPFMDSLSFTFLSYFSWEVATRLVGGGISTPSSSLHSIRKSWKVTALASFLMMYLDIIIDPVALRGDKWFLGKLYWYPEGGVYFGITIENFIGWFFVCFAIIRLYIVLEKLIFKKPIEEESGVCDYSYKSIGPLGLYYGVIVFNLFMTFWIGETMLGITGAIIVMSMIVMMVLAFYKNKEPHTSTVTQ